MPYITDICCVVLDPFTLYSSFLLLMDQQRVQAQAIADFRDALNRIGFLPVEQQAIIDFTGCTNLAMLGLLLEEDITKMCKNFRTRPINPVPLTLLQEKLLLGLRFWIASRQRLQLLIDPDEVTPALVFTQANIRTHMVEDEARADKELTAKMPDKFKTPSNWKIFAEALETYLGQLKGTGRIPLRYVIRRIAVPPPDVQYQTEQEQSVALVPLSGPDYQRDNVRVYGIIKQLVLEGPGRSYIMPFDKASDGRAAWLSLVGHFEGDSYRNRNVEEAYAMLENIHYEGERKGFNFEKFIEKHNEAFLELSRYGEPVLESKKVRDFLARIHAPELAAAKQQVKATPTLLNNFQEAANFIALSVTPIKTNTRNIGAVSRNTLNAHQSDGRIGMNIRMDTQSTTSSLTRLSSLPGRGQPSRGRGGRFPYRGRADRGRGRGRTNTAYYSPAEWDRLTPAQRDQVLTARGTKRNISTLISDYSVDIPPPDGVYEYNEYNYDQLNASQEAKDEIPDAINFQENHQIAGLSTDVDSHSIANSMQSGNQFGQRSRSRYCDESHFIGMFSSSKRMVKPPSTTENCRCSDKSATTRYECYGPPGTRLSCRYLLLRCNLQSHCLLRQNMRSVTFPSRLSSNEG